MSNTAKLKKRRLLITLSASLTLILATTGAILFAKGYRFNPKKGSLIKGTGLLSATSHPQSAQVYINDKLTTATNDTVNLPPDTYQVKISKQGYLPWQKSLPVQTELVTTADARLFPSVPSLTALTYTDAQNPTPSPNGQKLAYVVNHSQPPQNGLYVLDLNNSLLPLKRQPTQIAVSTDRLDFSQATLTWSPDSKQVLAAFTDSQDQSITHSFLLENDRLNKLADTPDVTIQLPLIFTNWEQELTLQENQNLSTLPEFIQKVATSSAKNLYFSPDGEKLLYTATEKLTIPPQLDQPLASTNPTPQTRQLQPNQLYVYDIKEDTNFSLGDAPQTDISQTILTPITPSPSPDTGATTSQDLNQPSFNQLQKAHTPLQTLQSFKAHYSALFTNNPQWFPTSRHLITTTSNQITIKEYDNQNPTTVYSGPFDSSFVYPSPNGNRLIILTNLNQNDQPFNLYTLDLK